MQHHLLAALALGLVCTAQAQPVDRCWDVEQQAGSREGNNPCAGFVYRTKICGSSQSAAAQTAPFLGGILDSFLTAAECRLVVQPYCEGIKEGATVNPDAGCELLCGALSSRAVALCNNDGECDSSSEIYAGDPLTWAPDVMQGLINGAVGKMCCSYLEEQLRNMCTGIDDAALKTYIDTIVSDDVCSVSPTCLDTTNAAPQRAASVSFSSWALLLVCASLSLFREAAW